MSKGRALVLVFMVSSAHAEDVPKDTAHFRFGLGLDGNVLVAPNLAGLAAGIQVRLGAQINQWFATYYQAHGLVGGVVTSDAGGLLGGVFNSALAELTLPVVHVGAGPSLDVFGIAGCSTSGCGSGSNVFFGIEGRVAIVIGGHGPGRHGGFAINTNVHPTFIGDSVLTTISLGVGGEMY